MNAATSSTTNPSNIQGACPTGWHLPSEAEWTQLVYFIGDDYVSGGKLKETGYTHWYSPNTGATNETGFTALPGGGRYDNGMFNNIGSTGYWWSATEIDAANAFSHYMSDSYNNVSRRFDYKEEGFSVRCVRD